MSAPTTAFDDTLDQFLEKHPGQTEADFLLAWEERWNKRIDKDVQVLGEGLGKIVDAFEVSFSHVFVYMLGVTDTGCSIHWYPRRMRRKHHTSKHSYCPQRY